MNLADLTNEELVNLISEIKIILYNRETSVDKDKIEKFVNELFEDSSLDEVKNKIIEGLESIPVLYTLEQRLKYGETVEHYIINYRYKGKTISYGLYTTVYRFSYDTNTEGSFVTDVNDMQWSEFNLPEYIKSEPFDFTVEGLCEKDGVLLQGDKIVPEPLWLLCMILFDRNINEIELPIMKFIYST